MQQPPARKGFVAPRPLAKPQQQQQQTQAKNLAGAGQDSTQSCSSEAPAERAVLRPVQPFKTVRPYSAPAIVKPSGAAQQRAPPASKPAAQATAGDQPGAQYKSVLYIKKETFLKKKATKNYADGILVFSADGSSTLHSLETGKVVTSGKVRKATSRDLKPFGAPSASYGKGGKGKAGKQDEPDSEEEDENQDTYILGTLVLEFQGDITAESFKSGACFGKQAATSAVPGAPFHAANGPATAAMKAFKPVCKTAGGTATAVAAPTKPAEPARGLHDPHAPDALILNQSEWQGTGACPIVVDPYLNRHLRPHQKEGVQFMWDCVQGKRAPGHSGCILADEMGLGKTLQVLTLIWTLLRQGQAGRPLPGKVIAVTPASLCGNWEKEVKRWLGSERMQVFMLGQQMKDATERILQFRQGTVVRLCITSYETLRKYSAALQGCVALLVCDEAHRLKAVGGSKTAEALQKLGSPRTVLLTGTPIQNNLEEFFALVSFVAPGLLGAPSAFRRVYADPIARAAERDACAETRELGASRASELARQANLVMLRRTQAILTRHLPPLVNYCLFCAPTQTQITVYQHVIKRALAGMNNKESTDATLSAIAASDDSDDVTGAEGEDNTNTSMSEGPAVKKKQTAKGQGTATTETKETQGVSWAPPGVPLDADNPSASGKMAVLRALVERVVRGGERMVVVSTSTAALDCVHKLVVTPLGLHAVRIDGGTSVDERQSIVDAFNTRGVGQVFLLSTRAGGAGLNLIGASHLVLYSSDWNPAADQQAMARIWRDGQRRPCHVWRLLTTGTIEEKIYQRQIMKGSLAMSTLTSGAGGAAGPKAGGGGRQFTREELRGLFTLTQTKSCETWDLLAAGGTTAASGRHVRWLTGPSHSPSDLPSDCSTALSALLTDRLVSAANVALKSEELSEEDSETTLTQEQQEQQQQQQQQRQHQQQQEKPAEPHGDVPERAQAPVQASAPEPTTMQAAQGLSSGGSGSLADDLSGEGRAQGSNGSTQQQARKRRHVMLSDSDEDVQLDDD